MEPQLDLFKSVFNRFHNTTEIQGPELIKREMRTGSQNKAILAFFRRHPVLNLTPFEIQHAIHLEGTPITSIRRALSDLTKLGYLVKTDIKRKGNYGADCYCWTLAS